MANVIDRGGVTPTTVRTMRRSGLPARLVSALTTIQI